MNRHSWNRGGFTLIEVLVVVAIIATLIAILVPSLSRAREQGRQTVCLANFRQILNATGMYEQDYKGWFPFGPGDAVSDIEASDGRKYRCMGSTCMWGGRKGEIHGNFPDEYDRPLTGYIYRRMRLSEVELFHCPSDRGSPLYTTKEDKPLYTVCGNSYYLNVHGSIVDPANRTRTSPSTVVMYNEGNLMWLLGMYPPTILWSNTPFLYTTPQQGMGWHGRFSRFNLGFSDLHAANMYVDSRNTSGPGWTVKDFLSIWSFREN